MRTSSWETASGNTATLMRLPKGIHATIDIAEEIGNTTLLVRCLALLPFVFRQRGQLEEVRGVITRALAMPEARNIALIKGHRAWIAWRDSNPVEAEVYGRASVEERQGRREATRFAGQVRGLSLASHSPKSPKQ